MMVYLAHPVGHGPQRDINLQNVQIWFKFLIDHTDWAISLPWLAYVSNLDEATYRDRGIRDDIHGLSRCDAVVLCGSHVSAGMLAEMREAKALGLPVIDLTGAVLPEPEIAAHIPDRHVVLPGKQGQIRDRLGQLQDGIAASGLYDVAQWAKWEMLSRKAEALAADLYALSDQARREIAQNRQLELPL